MPPRSPRSPGRARSAVRLIATGVPRLWRSAREAGADRTQALDVVLASLQAFSRAARGRPSQWRRQNAVRHFSWQAYLAARHGEALARAVAAAQERGSADVVDSAVDEENNRLGREHGLAHAAQLRSGGRSSVLASLTTVAEHKWRARELRAQPLADGSDPRS